jgi:phage-related minor tail protein
LKDSREKMMEGMPDARKRAEEILSKMKEFRGLGEETFRTLENAVKGFGDKFTDTFTEMVTTGKASFSDLARSIIQDLIRITMYTTVTQPLSNWLVGGITSLAGGLSGGNSRASAGIQQPGGLPQYATQGFAEGGWLMEPIIGTGLRTGTTYTLAERGPELVVPQSKMGGTGQVNNVTVNVNVTNAGARTEVSGADAKGLGNAIKAAVLNVLAEQKRPGGMLNG